MDPGTADDLIHVLGIARDEADKMVTVAETRPNPAPKAIGPPRPDTQT
jgi:hypothetical protein